MQRDQPTSSTYWPSLALIAGGGLMIGLWLIYTHVHGPTSYDLNRPFLGQRTLFWRMLLGGPPNLLVAAALLGLAPRLTQGAPRRARIGLGLAVFGLVVSGAIDLIIRAIAPPFLVPVVGIGLLILAVGRPARSNLPRAALTALAVIGALALLAMAWWFVPLDVFDALKGYRWYGLMAHVGPGLG
jgi:hypothetical protein